MRWIELHIVTSAEQAEQLGHQLTFWGAQAITFQDAGNHPIYEPTAETPRIWQETTVIGLFDAKQSITAITTYLETEKKSGLLSHFVMRSLEDEDWVRKSLAHFQPLCFGKQLWICPSWHLPPEPEALTIILDPGLAFGTGSHPTTALCLNWLAEHIQSPELVIDYGCGSGILALAALKLGAKQVLAVDTDLQALESTEFNGEKNHLYPPALETYFPDELMDQQADLIVANILAQPLIELAPRLAQLIKPHGQLVLSGILREQVNEVIEAYQPWFIMQEPVYSHEWARIEGRKML